MARIDYFFSTLSPWTYLAGPRLAEIVARHEASISYHPLDIIALFARTGGTAPADRHPSRMAYRAQDLSRTAQSLNMPFNLKPAFMPVNPAPSSYAIIAAQNAKTMGAAGDMGALVQGFLRAAWAEERNISEDGVIRDVLAKSGFDPGLADSGLFIGAETYGRNLEQAVERGVFGAPFFVVAETDARFWGQDRLAALDMHLAGK
jgi:2-hydroxychromene-2-carboxylate isomerase